MPAGQISFNLDGVVQVCAEEVSLGIVTPLLKFRLSLRLCAPSRWRRRLKGQNAEARKEAGRGAAVVESFESKKRLQVGLLAWRTEVQGECRCKNSSSSEDLKFFLYILGKGEHPEFSEFHSAPN